MTDFRPEEPHRYKQVTNARNAARKQEPHRDRELIHSWFIVLVFGIFVVTAVIIAIFR